MSNQQLYLTAVAAAAAADHSFFTLRNEHIASALVTRHIMMLLFERS